MDPQNNINPAPAPVSTSNNGSSAGPIIGIIVILAVVILGGLYFWGQRSNEVAPVETNLTDESVNAIQIQSTTDDTSSIEADLNATDIETLDAEINAS